MKHKFFVKGLPPDLDKHLCSEEIFNLFGWEAVAIREVSTSYRSQMTTWLVGAGSPPSAWVRYICPERRPRGETRPVTIEEDRGKAGGKGKKGTPLRTATSKGKGYASSKGPNYFDVASNGGSSDEDMQDVTGD